jgi:hypothetical protein
MGAMSLSHTLDVLLHSGVTGWKVNTHGRAIEPLVAGGDFHGVLIDAPCPGQSMCVLRLPGWDTLMTSAVREISLDTEGAVRVETANSTYRLSLIQPPE